MIISDSFDYMHGVREGRFSLGTLNSLTKYPSIETYHPLGAKGILHEPAMQFTGEVEITEKVDGTNARLIVLPDGMVIVGSREELLWATGDLIHNPAQGIVETLQSTGVAAGARAQLGTSDRIRVIYGEVYGDGIGPAGKRYSAGRAGLRGFRIFDVASVPVEPLVWSKEEAAAWRERGGQRYELPEVVKATADLLGVQRVPRVGLADAQELPNTVTETSYWLRNFVPYSRVALALKEGESVHAEGVVLRGWDASGVRRLAKVRYEDYERTLRDVGRSLKHTLPDLGSAGTA